MGLWGATFSGYQQVVEEGTNMYQLASILIYVDFGVWRYYPAMKVSFSWFFHGICLHPQPVERWQIDDPSLDEFDFAVFPHMFGQARVQNDPQQVGQVTRWLSPLYTSRTGKSQIYMWEFPWIYTPFLGISTTTFIVILVSGHTSLWGYRQKLWQIFHRDI